MNSSRALMPVRRMLTVAGGALIAGFALAVPAAADVSARPAAAAVNDLSSGRIGALAAAALGLIGVVAGVLAIRSASRSGTGSGRRGAFAGLAAGLLGLALGALVVA